MNPRFVPLSVIATVALAALFAQIPASGQQKTSLGSRTAWGDRLPRGGRFQEEGNFRMMEDSLLGSRVLKAQRDKK